VGKSALFNKLTGTRASIVEDVPGVTRDRLYGTGNWRGRDFTVIDTGGIEPDTKELIPAHSLEQANIAVAHADALIMVCDIHAGVTAADLDIARILQKSGKPIAVCVNKCDSIGEDPAELYEFYNLGIGEPIAVSSLHGHGTGDLLDEVFDSLPAQDSEDEDDGMVIKVAVIGKPNAGKSSLINKLLGEDRLIVSEIAGTTRDAVDTKLTKDGKDYVFIDTAGIRRKSRVEDNVERYSVMRAYLAVDRADVAVMMIDAGVGFTEQDSKIAGYAHDNGKATVIAVNKWDSIAKDDKTMKEFTEKLNSDFSFMSYAPFVFISAKTGQRIDKLFEQIDYTCEQNARRITTGALNDLLAYATARVQPPTDRGRRLKLYYMTQASVKPPTFVVFCNKAELFHFSYQRYIENQIREAFSLNGTPIRIVVRERGEGK
jgi:GTP-binding protein